MNFLIIGETDYYGPSTKYDIYGYGTQAPTLFASAEEAQAYIDDNELNNCVDDRLAHNQASSTRYSVAQILEVNPCFTSAWELIDTFAAFDAEYPEDADFWEADAEAANNAANELLERDGKCLVSDYYGATYLVSTEIEAAE